MEEGVNKDTSTRRIGVYNVNFRMLVFVGCIVCNAPGGPWPYFSPCILKEILVFLEDLIILT